MSFRMPSVQYCVKATTISPLSFSKRSRGEEGSGPKWGRRRSLRVHHGRYEEDGLATWVALAFPGATRVSQGVTLSNQAGRMLLDIGDSALI